MCVNVVGGSVMTRARISLIIRFIAFICVKRTEGNLNRVLEGLKGITIKCFLCDKMLFNNFYHTTNFLHTKVE